MEWAVTAVSMLALLAWVAVLRLYWHDLANDRPLPQPVQEAAIVALLSALVAGTIASFGFSGAVDSGISAVFAGGWRAAVLACGLYALAAATIRRRGR